MARKALTKSCLTLVQALERVIPQAISQTGVPRCRIGLSGGADSLALTAAFAWARDFRNGPLAGLDLSARVVDHRLQTNSAAVAEQAVAQAERLGIAATVVRANLEARSGQGVEAAARQARLAALAKGEEALIILGHTLDDQAETVLLGLARGSGTRSLSGMAVVNGRIVRPLLGLRRADTRQACADWGLSWWDDPMNRDPAYARSRLRTALVTLEDTLGPGLAEALARTAELCRQDADCLDALAASGQRLAGESLEISSIEELDSALRHRILLGWLRDRLGHSEVSRRQVLAVDSLITDWHGQKALELAKGRVQRSGGRLFVEPVA